MSRLGKTVVDGEERFYKRGVSQAEYTPWMKDVFKGEGVVIGDYMSDWLNTNNVRSVLHIPSKVQAYSGCVQDPEWEYHLQEEGSYWIYSMLKNQYKILIFSGDTDGAVPTYGTERWINDLGWNVTKEWAPWVIDNQVAGYKKSFDGLDFVTIHGVGHLSP